MFWKTHPGISTIYALCETVENVVRWTFIPVKHTEEIGPQTAHFIGCICQPEQALWCHLSGGWRVAMRAHSHWGKCVISSFRSAFSEFVIHYGYNSFLIKWKPAISPTYIRRLPYRHKSSISPPPTVQSIIKAVSKESHILWSPCWWAVTTWRSNTYIIVEFQDFQKKWRIHSASLHLEIRLISAQKTKSPYTKSNPWVSSQHSEDGPVMFLAPPT